MTDNTARKDEGKSGVVVQLHSDGPALTIHGEQEYWSEAQLAALESIGLKDCPDADRMAFLHLCQKTGLDPFTREIYLIGRKDRDMPSGKRWTAQTGIDGFRHIAERTGVYGGRIGPLWCGEDGEWRDVWLGAGPPRAARVGLIRTDKVDPATGGSFVTWSTCLYDEYVPLVEIWEGTGNGRRPKRDADGNVLTKPGGLWGKMPANQLAKCAEAAAVRAAFPRAATGVYEQAEMDQADALVDARAAAEGREDLRAALANRPWRRGEPGGDPDAPDVVDGEVVVLPPREDLWAELEAQARLMGVTVTRWTQRWVQANRKNADDATDTELFDLVRSRRQMVEDKAVADGVDAPAHAVVSDEAGQAVRESQTGGELVLLEGAPEPVPAEAEAAPDGPVEVAEGQGALLPAEDPQGPTDGGVTLHAFVDDGEGGSVCAAPGCGRYVDDEDAHGAP